MRDFALDEPAALVYCPFRALLHLPTWQDRRRVFERVAAALAAGRPLRVERVRLRPAASRRALRDGGSRHAGREPDLGVDRVRPDRQPDRHHRLGRRPARASGSSRSGGSTARNGKGWSTVAGLEVEALYGDFDRGPFDRTPGRRSRVRSPPIHPFHPPGWGTACRRFERIAKLDAAVTECTRFGRGEPLRRDRRALRPVEPQRHRGRRLLRRRGARGRRARRRARHRDRPDRDPDRAEGHARDRGRFLARDARRLPPPRRGRRRRRAARPAPRRSARTAARRAGAARHLPVPLVPAPRRRRRAGRGARLRPRRARSRRAARSSTSSRPATTTSPRRTAAGSSASPDIYERADWDEIARTLTLSVAGPRRRRDDGALLDLARRVAASCSRKRGSRSRRATAGSTARRTAAARTWSSSPDESEPERGQTPLQKRHDFSTARSEPGGVAVAHRPRLDSRVVKGSDPVGGVVASLRAARSRRRRRPRRSRRLAPACRACPRARRAAPGAGRPCGGTDRRPS